MERGGAAADRSESPIEVIFVCLGNICRSPVAENVFRHVVREAGLENRFAIDSAGTSAYHIDEPPDRRAAAEARRRGLELVGRARQLEVADVDRADYIVVMDLENLEAVRRLAKRGSETAEVLMLGRFDPEADGEAEVPDPYFGGAAGFERVHDMVERACRGLLDHIRSERAL